jgi:branched-chain amino acid transport system permease protein
MLLFRRRCASFAGHQVDFTRPGMDNVLSAATSVAFHGIAFAMVLYLISVGLSVTMGMMGFVNLAHGVFAMAGGYVMTTVMNRYGMPLPAALVVAAAAVMLASLPVERLLYRRLYGGDELDQVLLTMGLVFMSGAAAQYLCGPLQQPLRLPPALNGGVRLGFGEVPAYDALLIACGAALVTALWFGIERSRFGAKIRAAVDNLRMAQSVGIDTSRLFSLTFALGCGLAALGGGLGASLITIAPGYALDNLVYFLVVVAIGGLGSIRGPFLAALLVGVADSLGKYLIPQFGAFFIYAMTMAILLWRPRSLPSRAGIACAPARRCPGSPPSPPISAFPVTCRSPPTFWRRSCLRCRPIWCWAMPGS